MPDDDVEARVTSLEHEVARLREQLALTSSDATAARVDAAAGRVLAAGADRDVSDVRTQLRAHTQALNALRETQLEQGQQMRDGFATVATGMADNTALLAEISGSERDG